MLRTPFDLFLFLFSPPSVSREHKSHLLRVSPSNDEDVFSRAWVFLLLQCSRLPGLQVAKERPLRDARAYSGRFLPKISAIWFPPPPPIRSTYTCSVCISLAGASQSPSLPPFWFFRARVPSFASLFLLWKCDSPGEILTPRPPPAGAIYCQTHRRHICNHCGLRGHSAGFVFW